MASSKKLSENLKQEIWARIYQYRSPDDRDPEDVIETVYKGDIDRYLDEMAHFLGILPHRTKAGASKAAGDE